MNTNKFTLPTIVIAAAFALLSSPHSRAQFTFASDNASNYGGTWNNGSDQGTGFGGWGLNAGSGSGSFIGNPANNGMGTTGIGTTAFGVYANGSGYMNAGRGLDAGLGVGDTLSFYWAMNWDANGGAKGFDLKSGGTTVFNVNNGGSATITAGGNNAFTAYGTTPMLVTLSRTSGSQYSFEMTARDGGSAYSTTINSSSSIDNFNFYIGNQNNDNGNRNVYFNTFSVANSGVFSTTRTVTSALTGGGALVVSNNSTLTLTSDGNTFTGGTTVQSGSTLSVGNGGGTGDIGGNIINNGSVIFDRNANTLNYGGEISGSGSLTKSGNGGQINLNASNSYAGVTTVSGGSLEAVHAHALGSTAAGTIVSSGANLKLFGDGAGISFASEAITLNGLGPAYGDVSGDSGALRSVGGGNNTWNGGITLGSNSRINADSAGGAGSLTIAGNVNGGANVLYLGTKTGSVADITISGIISGAGNSQDGTATSLFKDGAGLLTLSGNNTYSGDTRITAGTLTVASGGDLGDGTSDVFISSGATLNVDASSEVASLRETGNSNGGVAAIGSGATLTVSGNAYNAFMNSISGSGNLVKSGTGTMNLYGNQTYTGTTTVSGGKLSSAVGIDSSAITVSGGTFETTAANVVGDTTAVTVNGGTYSVGGTDAIGAISGSGGTINITNGTLTTSFNGSSNSYAGAITGSGAFAKAGSGTLTLSGNNNKAGANTVSGGKLEVQSGGTLAGTTTVQSGGTLDADGTLSGAVTVNSGGTLMGGGTVGALTINGVLAPGNSAGTTTASGGAFWNQGGSYSWEIFDLAGPAGTGWDLLSVSGGALDLTGITSANGFTINLITLTSGNSAQGALSGFSPTATYTNWMIASAPSITGFTASEFNLNSSLFVGATGTFAIEQRAITGGQGLFVTYSGGGSEPIPEPGTWAAAALLAGAAGYVRWRRRKLVEPQV
jgi:fibronectin-binding autotransporter adhesin